MHIWLLQQHRLSMHCHPFSCFSFCSTAGRIKTTPAPPAAVCCLLLLLIVCCFCGVDMSPRCLSRLVLMCQAVGSCVQVIAAAAAAADLLLLFVTFRCLSRWVLTCQAVSSWSLTEPSPTTSLTLRTRRPWRQQ
jgi:hypothetical protein